MARTKGSTAAVLGANSSTAAVVPARTAAAIPVEPREAEGFKQARRRHSEVDTEDRQPKRQRRTSEPGPGLALPHEMTPEASQRAPVQSALKKVTSRGSLTPGTAVVGPAGEHTVAGVGPDMAEGPWGRTSSAKHVRFADSVKSPRPKTHAVVAPHLISEVGVNSGSHSAHPSPIPSGLEALYPTPPILSLDGSDNRLEHVAVASTQFASQPGPPVDPVQTRTEADADGAGFKLLVSLLAKAAAAQWQQLSRSASGAGEAPGGAAGVGSPRKDPQGALSGSSLLDQSENGEKEEGESTSSDDYDDDNNDGGDGGDMDAGEEDHEDEVAVDEEALQRMLDLELISDEELKMYDDDGDDESGLDELLEDNSDSSSGGRRIRALDVESVVDSERTKSSSSNSSSSKGDSSSSSDSSTSSDDSDSSEENGGDHGVGRKKDPAAPGGAEISSSLQDVKSRRSRNISSVLSTAPGEDGRSDSDGDSSEHGIDSSTDEDSLQDEVDDGGEGSHGDDGMLDAGYAQDARGHVEVELGEILHAEAGMEEEAEATSGERDGWPGKGHKHTHGPQGLVPGVGRGGPYSCLAVDCDAGEAAAGDDPRSEPASAPLDQAFIRRGRIGAWLRRLHFVFRSKGQRIPARWAGVRSNMSNAKVLWESRLATATCLRAIEDQKASQDQLGRKRQCTAASLWLELDDTLDSALRMSRALTAGAPLPKPKPKPPCRHTPVNATRGTLAGGALKAGGWHWPYGSSEAPYWTVAADRPLNAPQDAAATATGAAGNGQASGSASGGPNGSGDGGGEDKEGTSFGGVASRFGFRIRHQSVGEVSVQEARARAARLYRTGSDGGSSDNSSSISTTSNSSSGNDDTDSDEMVAELGNQKGLGTGSRGVSMVTGKRQDAPCPVRVRKVDELIAVPDPECDDAVHPADDVRLEPASTAFFDEYFWEQCRTVRKQYGYTIRDGPCTSHPCRQGPSKRRQQRRFAHWEHTLHCTHPGCSAVKLIHFSGAVPGHLTPEELAASGLRVWVVRPAGHRGEHNHAAPGGGGVLLRQCGRPLSELHRLVPEGLEADMPLASMLPLPLPLRPPPPASHQQHQDYTGPGGQAAAAAAATTTAAGTGLMAATAACSVHPGIVAAAATWLIEPPPPPLWRCRGLVMRAQGPNGSPSLAFCGATNRDMRIGPNDSGYGIKPYARRRRRKGRVFGRMCAACGACRPDGPGGWLRQLVTDAVNRYDPATVTPRQVYEHVVKATAVGSVAPATAVPVFSLQEITSDAFVVLMQRVASALLQPHLPPLPHQAPPSSPPMPAGSPAAASANAAPSVAESLIAAVVRSAAWSWPGLHLMRPELGDLITTTTAVAAAAVDGASKSSKKPGSRTNHDVQDDPNVFVLGDGECLDAQRAAGALAVAGGSGGGPPAVVDVEELGDWHMPLAFRQLQRAIEGAASAGLGAATTSRQQQQQPSTESATRPAPSVPAVAVAAAAARSARAVEAASHAVMAALGSFEWPRGLRDPKKPMCLGTAALLGDPYGTPSGSTGASETSSAGHRHCVFPRPVGFGRGLFGRNNGGGSGGSSGVGRGSARPGSESDRQVPSEIVQVLHVGLERCCPQIAALVVPLASGAKSGNGPGEKADVDGDGDGAGPPATGDDGDAVCEPAATRIRKDALAWNDPEAMRPALELCGPAVRLHNPDADGLRIHPIGMPYMVSKLEMRRRFCPSLGSLPQMAGGGFGAPGNGSCSGVSKLGSRELFLHCLRRQLHLETEIFGGPVGQLAGLQLHASGPLHWLPEAAQQQAVADAAIAAALQTSAAAAVSRPEELAAALHGAVSAALRSRAGSAKPGHPGSNAAGNSGDRDIDMKGADVSAAAAIAEVASGAQLDLLSPSLVARPADPQLAAAAAVASAADIGTLYAPMAATAASMYGASIALSRGAVAPQAIRPAFYYRPLPRSTVSLIVQFSIAWGSRQCSGSSKSRKHHRQHPPWALEGTPMGDPWDVVGIAVTQRHSSGSHHGKGDAHGDGGSRLTRRMLRRAKRAAAAASGASSSSSTNVGVAGAYQWRAWVPTPGAEGQSGQKLHVRGSRKGLVDVCTKKVEKREKGKHYKSGDATSGPPQPGGANATALLACHGDAVRVAAGAPSAGRLGDNQASREGVLPPVALMAQELLRRSMFRGKGGVETRVLARVKEVMGLKGPGEAEDSRSALDTGAYG